MRTEREWNYDLLKIVSMFAVIMIHASAIWVKGFSAYVAANGALNDLACPITACIYNTMGRFAVPCFIMLSGAFILDDDKTIYYKEFYTKKIVKIGIPTLLFSLLYILYRIPMCFIGENNCLINFIRLIADILRGSPFNHMWYLYMLIGVYFLAPVVMRFKNSISYKSFRKIVYLFLIAACFSNWTSEARMNWDLGQSFEYLGYFMVGYVIRKDCKKSNNRALLFILLGLMIEIPMAFVEYEIMIKRGIQESNLIFGIVDPYSPPIVLASVLIFWGFSSLQIRYHKWIAKLSEMSFFIYLFHSGVNNCIENLINVIKGKNYILLKLNNLYAIPLFVVAVFLISFLLTAMSKKQYEKRAVRI